MFRTDAPTIPLKDLQWEEIGEEGDPSSRLLAHIRIGSLDMHLEAWEVENRSRPQVAKAGSMRKVDLELLIEIMDCYFRTITIEGREYVLVATPYGE